jgi:hypothetical protein
MKHLKIIFCQTERKNVPERQIDVAREFLEVQLKKRGFEYFGKDIISMGHLGWEENEDCKKRAFDKHMFFDHFDGGYLKYVLEERPRFDQPDIEKPRRYETTEVKQTMDIAGKEEFVRGSREILASEEFEEATRSTIRDYKDGKLTHTPKSFYYVGYVDQETGEVRTLQK